MKDSELKVSSLEEDSGESTALEEESCEVESCEDGVVSLSALEEFPSLEEEEPSASELDRAASSTISGSSVDVESPQAVNANGRAQQARERAILCRPMFMGQIPPAFKYKKGLADSLCFPLKTEYDVRYARNGVI